MFTMTEVVTGEVPRHERAVTLKELSVMTGNNLIPTASLKAVVRGKECTSAQMGIGPVDAVIHAVQEIIRGEIGGDVKLKDFRIEAITGGSDALAEVIVGVEKGGRTVTARGVREDIVMASVEAFINAVNRLMQE